MKKLLYDSRFIAFICFFVAVIFLISGVISIVESFSVPKNHIKTDATIFEYKSKLSVDENGSDVTIYCPVVSFSSDNGERALIESSNGKSYKEFAEGSSVKIIYSPDCPEDFEVFNGSSGVGSTVFLLIIAAAAAMVGVFQLKRKTNYQSENDISANE